MNHLLVCKNKDLLIDKAYMQNLPCKILAGTSKLIAQPSEGRQLKVLCVELDYSPQVGTQ